MPVRKHTARKRQQKAPRTDLAKQQITQTAREAQALTFRIAGASYDQIALQMGYRNRSGAWKAVQEALRKTIQEPADKVREMELARLDRMLVGIWQPAITPGSADQFDCLDRVLKIMAQRAWYILGLKVPDKVAPTTPDGTQPYPGEGLAALLTFAQRSTNGYAGHPSHADA
jgi:hypothetical protein